MIVNTVILAKLVSSGSVLLTGAWAIRVITKPEKYAKKWYMKPAVVLADKTAEMLNLKVGINPNDSKESDTKQ